MGHVSVDLVKVAGVKSETFNNSNIIYSNIAGGYSGEGNINEDPLFNNPDDGDFTLQPNSPCIDAGNPETEYDSDGSIAEFRSGLREDATEEEFWDIRIPQINTRASDMSYLIDKLQTMQDYHLYNSIDFNKIDRKSVV